MSHPSEDGELVAGVFLLGKYIHSVEYWVLQFLRRA